MKKGAYGIFPETEKQPPKDVPYVCAALWCTRSVRTIIENVFYFMLCFFSSLLLFKPKQQFNFRVCVHKSFFTYRLN